MKKFFLIILGLTFIFIGVSCQKDNDCSCPANQEEEDIIKTFNSLPAISCVYSSFGNPHPPDFNGYQFRTEILDSVYAKVKFELDYTGYGYKTLMFIPSIPYVWGLGENNFLIVFTTCAGCYFPESYLFYKGVNITILANPDGYVSIDDVRLKNHLLYIKYYNITSSWSHDPAFYSRFNLETLQIEATQF